MDSQFKSDGGEKPTNFQNEKKISSEKDENSGILTRKENTGVQLRREIGIFSAVNLIIGCMIGSGIFISPTSALERSGSVGLCLIIWAVCGVISMLGALSFAELGTLVPKSGGEYSYFLAAFKNLHPFWGEVPSFLSAWTSILILLPASNSVVFLTFAEYVCQPFSGYFNGFSAKEKDWIKRSIAIFALGLVTTVNLVSVKLYVKLQNLFTISKLTACVVIIIGGIYALCLGKTENFDNSFQNSTTSPKDVVLAFYSGLWAYGGWNAITVVTEEVKNPEKVIPLSIGIAVPTVTSIYLMMNVAYMAVLTVPEMLAAPAVAVEFGSRILGALNFIIPLGVALSTFGNALNGLFSTARLCYVAAREGHMPEILSYVHNNRLTPAPAVALQGLIMLTYILAGNIYVLINFTSFLAWIFIALAMVALIVMRYTKKDHHRPYKVPIIVPIITILIAIFLSMVPIVQNPTPEYLFAVGLLLLGFLVYVLLIYYKKTPKRFMNKLTHIVKTCFDVAPPGKETDLAVKI